MNSKKLSQSNGNEELFVIIRDDVTDWIIQNGLSKTESKLFFYFLRIDRFGDRPVKLKVAEILLATGIGKTAYHAAIAKFEALGWFDFKHTEVTISNNTGLSSSEKRTEKPESRTEKPESRTEKTNHKTEKTNHKTGISENQPPEPPPSKASEVSHTIQTYKTYTDSLSESERESFLEFGQKKAAELPNPPTLISNWIKSHWEDLRSQWEKSQGKVSASQSSKWDNHPQRKEWLEKIRQLGPAGFQAEDMPNQKIRREFYVWADANNLIWGNEA